jgi:hypothetical protein
MRRSPTFPDGEMAASRDAGQETPLHANERVVSGAPATRRRRSIEKNGSVLGRTGNHRSTVSYDNRALEQDRMARNCFVELIISDICGIEAELFVLGFARPDHFAQRAPKHGVQRLQLVDGRRSLQVFDYLNRFVSDTAGVSNEFASTA